MRVLRFLATELVRIADAPGVAVFFGSSRTSFEQLPNIAAELLEAGFKHGCVFGLTPREGPVPVQPSGLGAVL